jgi:alpha-beta hydrolase superfamily lysophospholipase
LILAFVIVFILINILAYIHARAMTHFDAGTIRTSSPESLTLSAKARVLVTGVDNPRPENYATPEAVGLPFSVHLIHDDNDGVLEAWHIPHPDASGLVLMFHGYAACKASLLKEAEAFHDLGYSIFIVDFRGSGGSSGNETTLGICEADDVARVWEYSRRTWKNERIILYGQSMGSVAILRALALHEEMNPTAALLECPFDSLRSTVANRFTAMGLPPFPGADLLLFWGSVQMGFNGYRHRPVDYARSVGCPVLLMHGAKDTRVTRDQADAIFHNLPGTKRFHLFYDAGHESYLSLAPNEWRQTITTFLDQCP